MTSLGGAVPTISVIDYLSPTINRPDLYANNSYPIPKSTGGTLTGAANKKNSESSAFTSIIYTFGLITVSACLFVIIVAWANVLQTWLDSVYVSQVVDPVTHSRFVFACLVSLIGLLIIIILVSVWYYIFIKNNNNH